ncbi:MAG: hypothetical protein KAJ57_02915, partial [Woeseiaceae bacterium]|nr:hypothetical protein [Woeseiaceae bacterium]
VDAGKQTIAAYAMYEVRVIKRCCGTIEATSNVADTQRRVVVSGIHCESQTGGSDTVPRFPAHSRGFGGRSVSPRSR